MNKNTNKELKVLRLKNRLNLLQSRSVKKGNEKIQKKIIRELRALEVLDNVNQ